MEVSNKRTTVKEAYMRSGESGTALIEFAIVLPFLITILFGTIEFGLLMFNKQVLTNASREGARYGIVARDPRYSATEIAAVVKERCAGRLITFGTDNDPVNSTATFGQDLTVTATYDYDFLLIPGFVPGLPDTITLSAQTSMRYE
jgi:Flp pilus assembly protein TadG